MMSLPAPCVADTISAMKRLIPVLVILAALTGCAATSTPFQEALKHCKVHQGDSASLGDQNQTLTIQSFAANHPKGLVGDDVTCVLKALHVTDAVTQSIDGTRALDGMQSAKWGSINAKWTYQPEEGLRVILTTG